MTDALVLTTHVCGFCQQTLSGRTARAATEAFRDHLRFAHPERVVPALPWKDLEALSLRRAELWHAS